MQATNRFARPRTRSNQPAASVPPTVPTAIDVISRPNPTPSRPSGPGATTYRTRTAKTAVEARFIGPTTRAIVRSSRWWRRYDRPTVMSARIDDGGPVRTGRNEPVSVRRQSSAPR